MIKRFIPAIIFLFTGKMKLPIEIQKLFKGFYDDLYDECPFDKNGKALFSQVNLMYAILPYVSRLHYPRIQVEREHSELEYQNRKHHNKMNKYNI